MKTRGIHMVAFMLGACGFFVLPAAALDIKDFIPQKFTYRGIEYRHDPYWKDEELIIEENLDSDPEKEVIVAFGGVAVDGDKNKNQSEIGYFWQIYDKTPSGYVLKKTRWANGYPSNIVLHDLNGDEIPEIIIYGKSSIYRNNVYVYQWHKGRYRQIFGHATVYGVYVQLDDEPPFIEVGAPNWGHRWMRNADPTIGWYYSAKPLREIYTWDGMTFSYDELASSAQARYEVRTIRRAAVYRQNLFQDTPSLAKKIDGSFEYILLYLDNKKFYFILPSDNNNMEQLKIEISPDKKIRVEQYKDDLYKCNILFDQEVEFIAKHEPSLDSENPVFIFKKD